MPRIFTPFCTAFLATGFVLLISCSGNGKKAEKPQPATVKTGDSTIVKGNWEPFPLGDMNGDKVPDTAYVYTTAYHITPYIEHSGEFEFAGCVNDTCYNRIRFSAGYPEIWEGNSLWGTVEPIDDLDEDGINEFIFQTGWYIGAHASIYIYSFDKEKKQWVVLAHNWVYGEDSYKDRIKKVDKNKFKFNIEYTFEGEMLKKDTLIRIRK